MKLSYLVKEIHLDCLLKLGYNLSLARSSSHQATILVLWILLYWKFHGNCDVFFLLFITCFSLLTWRHKSSPTALASFLLYFSLSRWSLCSLLLFTSCIALPREPPFSRNRLLPGARAPCWRHVVSCAFLTCWVVWTCAIWGQLAETYWDESFTSIVNNCKLLKSVLS